MLQWSKDFGLVYANTFSYTFWRVSPTVYTKTIKYAYCFHRRGKIHLKTLSQMKVFENGTLSFICSWCTEKTKALAEWTEKMFWKLSRWRRGGFFGKDASSKTHRFKNDFFPYNSSCLGINPLMRVTLIGFPFPLSRFQRLNTERKKKLKK